MTLPPDAAQRVSRRKLLYEFGVATIGGFVSLLVAGPLVGFFPSVLRKGTSLQWVRVCSLAQIDTVTPRQFKVAFKGENTSEAFEDVAGVFVIRQADQILAFSNVCTHMGCSVRWLAWREQIVCPCHGGLYDRWGHLLGGPPAADLPFFLSRIEANDLYIANRILRRGVITERT